MVRTNQPLFFKTIAVALLVVAVSMFIGACEDSDTKNSDTKNISCQDYQKLENNACVATAYTCDNGNLDSAFAGQTPAENNEDNKTGDVQKCDNCDGGYRPDGDLCVVNRYICTNGTAVVATDIDKPDTDNDVEKCASCMDGFLASGDECLTAYNYKCTNGTVADEQTTIKDTTKCISCDPGYHLSATQACSFFVLEHTDDSDNVIGYTLQCGDASEGDSADIDLDGDGTDYTTQTYTKRNRQQILSDGDRSEAATTCTSGITNMSAMFQNKESFDGDISHWDTASVTDMSDMFRDNDNPLRIKFDQDIGNWDVSKVQLMNGMFSGAISFDQDIGGWDVSKVTKMQLMFSSAREFNQDISNWQVGKVTNMQSMFLDANRFNQDISKWDVSKASDMRQMFRSADDFDQDISGWCVQPLHNDEPQLFADNTSGDWDIDEKPDWDAAPVDSCP